MVTSCMHTIWRQTSPRPIIELGTVRIDLKFSAALNNTFTVVVFSEIVQLIKIDGDRNEVFNFGNWLR